MSQLNNETNSFLMVKPVITLQELSISLCTEADSRIPFSLDILTQNDIIPSDWQVSRSSVTRKEFTQLSFTNGVRLINRYDSITFIEPLMDQTAKAIIIADIAHKYVNAFPYINYKEASISIRKFVRFESSDRSTKELVNQYILTLLSSKIWLDAKPRPITTVIDLVYSFEQFPLNFKIKEVELHLPNNQVIPNILFLGIVTHNIEAISTSEKLQQLMHFINSWEKALRVYSTVLNNFLYQKKSS